MISTHWGVVLSLRLLFSSFFSGFIPRFMPPLLPVHLEKASHLSALYSAAAPARALAIIMFWILMICCVLIRRMAVNPHLLYFTNKTTSKVIVRKPVPSINMITPHTLHCRFKLQFVTKGLLDIRVYTKQTVIWKDIPMLRSHQIHNPFQMEWSVWLFLLFAFSSIPHPNLITKKYAQK